MRTCQYPHNTSALIAVGQGCGETLKVLEQFGANLHARNSDGLGILQVGARCSSTIKEIAWRHNVPMTYSRKTQRTECNGTPWKKHIRYSMAWSEDTEGGKDPQQELKEYPWTKRAPSMEAKHNAAWNGPVAKQHRSSWWSESASSRSGQYTNASSVDRKRHNDGVQPRPDRDLAPWLASPRDCDPWRDYKPASRNQGAWNR